MFGENGLTRVMLKEYDDTTALVLCDADGKQVWSTP